MGPILGLLSLVAGIALGRMFPDIDQATSFLVHRSMITHGPLVPFLVFLPASGNKPIPIRLFAMGMILAVAVHLCFDLFPRGWTGYALIHIPGFGWAFPLFSWSWIALSIICCLYMAMRLVRNALEGAMLVVVVLGAFGYAVAEEEALWRPLLSLIAATLSLWH